jgi:hypothetical protein
VLVLWILADYHGHPLAPAVLVAIGASIAAAAVKLPSADVLRPVGLDPDSTYHLAQLVGIALLFAAITGSMPDLGRTSDGPREPYAQVSD